MLMELGNESQYEEDMLMTSRPPRPRMMRPRPRGVRPPPGRMMIRPGIMNICQSMCRRKAFIFSAYHNDFLRISSFCGRIL